MKVLVTGGRDYADRDRLYAELDAVHATRPGAPGRITLIITGACAVGGADLLAIQWAVEREVDFHGYPAKFKTGSKGKAEGPIRNRRMFESERPELVIAFPGGKGTGDMVGVAENRCVTVRKVEAAK